MTGIHKLYTLYIDVHSSSAPVNVVYEECERKVVIEMQHNPSFAVPSQLTEKEGPGDEMADRKRNSTTY